MPILHPIFAIIFVFLAIGSYLEVYKFQRKQPLFVIIGAILMIVAAGLRLWAGADYPIYRNLFTGFSLYTEYGDVWDKAMFRKNSEQIEWLYVLLNKLIFDAGLPFFAVTFTAALISISIKLFTIYKNVEFPLLGILFYFMPIMFFEDAGQIRQGLAIAFCVFSFQFIKTRNLWMFLLCMYIALGFHKTAVVFIPAYWLVKIPMNSKRIFWVLILAIITSPLELYRIGGDLFSSIAPPDASDAYTGYVDDKYYGTEVESGLNDIVKLIMIVILIRYDKKACDNVWWYEYMRNLGVFGLVLFYFFRSNQIFAIRLPGVYLFFLTMFCLPSIVYALKDSTRKLLYMGFMAYLSMMFFYFGKGNGNSAGFTIGRYKNVLWK